MSDRGRRRAWQRMLSGRRLDIVDPSPLDVEIGDIAHGLARVARWNGQTRGPEIFSVAQHALLVEALFVATAPEAPARDRLAALLHDGPEYVIGDLISPFKAAVGGDYRRIETRLMRAIHIRFGLPPDLAPDLVEAHQGGRPALRLPGGDRARGLRRGRGAQALRRAGAPGSPFRPVPGADASGRGRGALPRPLRRTRRRGRARSETAGALLALLAGGLHQVITPFSIMRTFGPIKRAGMCKSGPSSGAVGVAAPSAGVEFPGGDLTFSR